MNKNNIMSAVLGVVVGLIVGFAGANSINKSSYEKQPAPVVSTNTQSGNPALPPDHPPLGTSSGSDEKGAALPQVTEAIEKAKKQPQDFEAQMTAADLYYQIKRFDDAAKFYEAAAKLKPNDAEALTKAGDAYFEAERYGQAEKWYLLALEKEPKNINVRNDLGLTFFLRTPRDIERAIKEYKTSLVIDPSHEMSLQNLVVAYTENGDKENLRMTLEKLKKVNPNNPAIAKAEAAK